MHTSRRRPRIVFLDYPDVFEDFYAHYDVSQRDFATTWSNTGAHDFLRILQHSIADVVWYEFSLRPELDEAIHQVTKSRVRFLRSPLAHRLLWRAYYRTSISWRYPKAYWPYAQLATYLANVSPRLLLALRRDRPDAFFLEDYSTGRFDIAILLGRLLGIPVVAWHTGSRPEGYTGMWARRFTLKRGFVIASSRAEVNMLVERFGVPPERTAVILTPMDLGTYRPKEAVACRRELGLPEAAQILLFVGRFDDAVKRITSMIEAIADLVAEGRDLHFVLVGGGNDEDDVREHAAEKLPGRAHFAGWIRDAATKALYYNAADALLLASVREGFPSVVGEALACGTPTVASEVGGIPEVIVNGETGQLFPSGDDRALRNSIRAMLDAPGLATSIRANCRIKAEQHLSEEVVTRQLVECLARAGMNALSASADVR